LLRGDHATASNVMFLLEMGEMMEDWTHKKSVDDLARAMSLNVDKVWMISSDGAAVAYTTSLLEQTVENGAITNGFQPDAEWVPVIEAGA